MINSTFSIKNQSNLKIMELDKWLEMIGSSWFLDGLYLFLFTPVSMLGVILNIFSFLVLTNKKFNFYLYKYLRIYCLNSTIVNLTGAFIFCSRSRRFLGFNNSYLSMLYECFIYIAICNTSYFYGGVLEIPIILERLCYLNKKLRWFLRFNPNKVCLVCLLGCLIINTPYFLFIDR